MKEVFERMERLRRQNHTQTLEQALGGAPRSHTYGEFYLRSQVLAGHLCHGPFPLSASQGEAVSGLLGEAGIRNPLFLDTETTGLAGGSGTYAFLIGLAFFEGGQLRIEQLLMRTHAEEKAMLGYLIERLNQSDALVTFNGKSFDGPLLQTRLIMNRLRFDLEDFPHLDLLPKARKVWSQALVNCRLETLETEILGLPRHDDIPGWMVPQVFFRYLQEGCPRGLARVAEHNRRDMLAMVGLVGGLHGYWQAPNCWQRRFRQCSKILHSEDLALGQSLYRMHRFEESAQLLERAWEYWGNAPETNLEAFRRSGSLLARLQRKLGDVQRSQQIWQTLAERYPEEVEFIEQVAKQHEHQTRDWPEALRWVERGLGLGQLTRGRRDRLLRRQQRLERKLQSA